MPFDLVGKTGRGKNREHRVLTEARHKDLIGQYQAILNHLLDQFEGGREVVDFTRAARVALRPCVLGVDHAIERKLPAAIWRSKVQ